MIEKLQNSTRFRTVRQQAPRKRQKSEDHNMKEFKTIGILTSGGDAPGMNAAVRAVTRTALARGISVKGIYNGYAGLIAGGDEIKPLGMRDVSNIINRGGTILYSARCLEFKTPEGQMKAVETCKKEGIDGIVAIGGDGTFRGAMALSARGIPCIGLPGTIDNDITATQKTIGYDTAMNTVIEMVDKLRDTSESHERCSVVEVMGRDAGDIALNSALASGATGVAIPEQPFDEKALFRKMANSRKLGKRNFIIIVSEGMGKDFGQNLSDKIERELGIESRFTRLGHVVRGGSPTVGDRVMATQMGVYAVEELLKGHSNLVICERHGRICGMDIHHALILDRMYKNKLEEGDLDGFSAEELVGMRADAEEKRSTIKMLYEIENEINV